MLRYVDNGCRIHGYINRENLSSIYLANMELINWSVRRREVDGVKGMDGVGYNYFSQLGVSTY